MHTISASEVRANFTKIANAVEHKKQRYVVTRNNHPSLMMISMEEVALLDKLLEEFEDQEDIRDAQARMHESSHPMEEVWKELGLDE